MLEFTGGQSHSPQEKKPALGLGERGVEHEETGEKGTLDGGTCVPRLGRHSLDSETGVTWFGWSLEGWWGSSG